MLDRDILEVQLFLDTLDFQLWNHNTTLASCADEAKPLKNQVKLVKLEKHERASYKYTVRVEKTLS